MEMVFEGRIVSSHQGTQHSVVCSDTVVGLTKFLKETQTKNFDLSFYAIATILLEYVSHFKVLFFATLVQN